MDEIRRVQIDNFIVDWYWDKKSYQFAFELCSFLFDFIDYLESQNLSERTIKTHSSNCWHIGILECQYGYKNEFKPEIFLSGPAHLIEFRRKMSDSKYAIDSYSATCRKLGKYVKEKQYLHPIIQEEGEEEEQPFPDDLYFFSKRMQVFETKLRIFGEWPSKDSLKKEAKIVFEEYIEWESSRNTKHFIQQLNKCIKALDKILDFLSEMNTETLAEEKESLIREGQSLITILVELGLNV